MWRMEPIAPQVVRMARAQLEQALHTLPLDELSMAAKLMIEEAIELALEIEYTPYHPAPRKVIKLRDIAHLQWANDAC